MARKNIATPIATLLMAVALSGCAATTPASSLQSMQQKAAQQLTADCFWKHEGERVVFGSAEVFSACRQWANRQVRVTFP